MVIRLLSCALLIAIACLVVPATSQAAGVIMYVNEAGDQSDANPGDGSCDRDPGTADPQCTLRAAIQEANATTDLDVVFFNIGFGSPRTVTPATALPAVTQPVWLAGDTQPGTQIGSPGIEINATNSGAGNDGLRFDPGSAGSTLSGFIVNRSPGYGVRVAADIPVLRCWIGTDIFGLSASPNASGGVLVSGTGASVGVGGRNVIAGNAGPGITVTGGSASIQSNWIGMDATGNVTLANGGPGILMSATTGGTIGSATDNTGNVISGNVGAGVEINGSTAVSIQNNTIGLSANGNSSRPNGGGGVKVTDSPNTTIGPTRNVISGNTGAGIAVHGSSAGTLIESNFVGAGPSGNTAFANSGFGIAVDAADVIVGGSTPPDANTVSGNTSGGVLVTADDATVLGNFIGATSAGTDALGNSGPGVSAVGASDLMLGGVDDGNVIAANNGPAIDLDSTTSAQVKGNLIGVDKDLQVKSVLANGDGTSPSISLEDGAAQTTIGGSQDGAGNYITGTKGTGAGIALLDSPAAGSGNSFIGNSISSNGGLAIDLGNNGLTANDGADGDGGPNGLQNAPVLTNVVRAAATFHFEGVLDTNPGPATYSVELFANTSCDAAGAGEAGGRTGTIQVPVDSSGHGSFSVDIGAATPTSQTTITAIATSPTGDSSEASSCIDAFPAGSLQFTFGRYSVLEDHGPAVLVVKREGRDDVQVSVSYTTRDDTAKAGTDYAATQGTLTFAPREVQKTIEIPIFNDTDTEGTKGFVVELSSPQSATLGPQFRTNVFITDDESLPRQTLLAAEFSSPPKPGGRVPTVPKKKVYCKVPKLKKLTKKKAKARLKKAHCKLGKVKKSKKRVKNRKLRNKVVAQKPKTSKKKRKNGTKVSITLGR